MSNNLFAFNVSQEIPETEMVELEDKAGYDADRQVWKGTGSTQLGSTGTRQFTVFWTMPAFHYDNIVDSRDTD